MFASVSVCENQTSLTLLHLLYYSMREIDSHIWMLGESLRELILWSLLEVRSWLNLGIDFAITGVGKGVIILLVFICLVKKLKIIKFQCLFGKKVKNCDQLIYVIISRKWKYKNSPSISNFTRLFRLCLFEACECDSTPSHTYIDLRRAVFSTPESGKIIHNQI